MITLGSRGSELALSQTKSIAGLLQKENTIKIIHTKGDKDQKTKLTEFSGSNIFTKELENALLSGEIDLAVHSLKDVTSKEVPGLSLCAFALGQIRNDVFISTKYKTLEEINNAKIVGTSSPRRRAQLLNNYKNMTFTDIRGNIHTRLQKLKEQELDGIILAKAGLDRLKMNQDDVLVLPLDKMIPAAGQGILAIQCRTEDVTKYDFLNEPVLATIAAVERRIMRDLDIGCSDPVGVHYEYNAEKKTGTLHFYISNYDYTDSKNMTFQIKPQEVNNIIPELKELKSKYL